MKRTITIALLLVVTGLGACKKAEDTINNTASQGSLSATVNGYAYTAGAATISVSDDHMWIKGRNFSNDEDLTILLTNYDRSKTKYTLDFSNNIADYTDGGSTHLHATTGELEIQHTGDKHARGTFHFEDYAGPKVTDGKFDISWD